MKQTNCQAKKYVMLTIILTSALFASSCILKNKTASNQIEYIEFGYGGGVTGKTTIYKIDKDGTLFANGVEKTKLDKKQTKQIFEKADKISAYRYNRPSNYSRFLTILKGKSKNRITWSIKDEKIKKEVNELYTELLSIV